MQGRHDSQNNVIQHNDTQHNVLTCDTQQNDPQNTSIECQVPLCRMSHFYCYAECHYAECQCAESRGSIARADCSFLNPLLILVCAHLANYPSGNLQKLFLRYS